MWIYWTCNEKAKMFCSMALDMLPEESGWTRPGTSNDHTDKGAIPVCSNLSGCGKVGWASLHQRLDLSQFADTCFCQCTQIPLGGKQGGKKNKVKKTSYFSTRQASYVLLRHRQTSHKLGSERNWELKRSCTWRYRWEPGRQNKPTNQ